MSLVLQEVPALLAASSCGNVQEVVPIEDLRDGLALGAKFLIHSQTDEGNFRYEYNWKKQKDSTDDNPVRQAGTLWGLVLAHTDTSDPSLYLPAIRKTLKYFARHSKKLDDGRRVIRYPGEKNKLGAVALVALAHIDLLRQPEKLAGLEEQTALQTDLDGYIKTLLKNEVLDGDARHVFHSRYGDDGSPNGKNSPYFDGESLLALVKAAKYLGRSDLWDRIERMAEAGWKVNTEPGLLLVEKKGFEHATHGMNGTYQWSSMVWYELLEADSKRFSAFAPRILRYADWMAGTQERSKGKGNTGSVFEGLIPSYLVAVAQNDNVRAHRIACTLRKINILNGMQVGHPKARGLASHAPDDDKRAKGGAQNRVNSPKLRIDTTQHQMHAILMLKLLLQKQHLI